MALGASACLRPSDPLLDVGVVRVVRPSRAGRKTGPARKGRAPTRLPTALRNGPVGAWRRGVVAPPNVSILTRISGGGSRVPLHALSRRNSDTPPRHATPGRGGRVLLDPLDPTDHRMRDRTRAGAVVQGASFPVRPASGRPGPALPWALRVRARCVTRPPGPGGMHSCTCTQSKRGHWLERKARAPSRPIAGQLTKRMALLALPSHSPRNAQRNQETPLWELAGR